MIETPTATLQIEAYDLADAALLDAGTTQSECMVFVPAETVVVIGKGSDAALEVETEAVADDGVRVLRRNSGGCAVVLSSKMVVVSFRVVEEPQRKSSEYFRLFNALIMEALAAQRVARLSHRGTSDIAIGERKIAGTALYRSRKLVFFHAVINAGDTTEAMERYLKHPPRTPDYRRDRKHGEFVTSLAEQGYSLNIAQFEQDVQQQFHKTFQQVDTA